MTTEEIISLVTKGISTFSFLLIIYGVAKRRTPKIHVPVMLTCFALDLGNVVIIEVSRLLGVSSTETEGGAVEQSVTSLADADFTLLDFHIAVSVLTLVCYGVAIWTGLALRRQDQSKRKVHLVNAGVFGFARIANYVTSFMI